MSDESSVSPPALSDESSGPAPGSGDRSSGPWVGSRRVMYSSVFLGDRFSGHRQEDYIDSTEGRGLRGSTVVSVVRDILVYSRLIRYNYK